MAKTKIELSVIIPNWNGLHLLKICLPSLEKQTFRNFEVIILENGSTDGSSEYLKKNYPEYKLIELKKNVGFSPAVNLGIKAAKSEYIVLLNNDTKVDKYCLKYLKEAADLHPEVGIVAAKMKQFYNPKLIDSKGDYIDVVGHADNIGRGEVDSKNDPEAYIFLATGGGSLIKKEVFAKIGLFDEDYFAYMEDVDFGLRSQIVGYKTWYQPKSVIYHIHKATSSKNGQLLEYLQFRNMTQTIIKDFPISLLKKDWNFFRIIAVNINTVKFLASQGYLKSALAAEWYILVNLFKLLRKRQKIQRQISIDLDEFNSNFRPKKLKVPFLGMRI